MTQYRKENGLPIVHHKTKEPHHRNKVAPRTPNQALDTLIWSVIWLFIINLLSTLLARIGENPERKIFL